MAGSINYDREQVERALTDSCFGNRLASFKKGLDTMLYKDLSENGVDGSGGEVKKIVIARRFTRMLHLLSLTSLRQHSSRLPKRRCTESLTRLQATRPQSISLTLCPLVCSVTRSPYCTSCETHRHSTIRKLLDALNKKKFTTAIWQLVKLPLFLLVF